jgi:excisionase family DNA binding protein
MNEQLLTVADVADLLKVSVSQVYVLKHTGLRSVRLGRKAVRFRKEDVIDFIEDNVVTTDR